MEVHSLLKHDRPTNRENLKKSKKPLIIVMPVLRDGASFYRITQPYTEMYRQDLAEIISPKAVELEDKAFWEALQLADWIVVRMMHTGFVEWLDKSLPNKKIVMDLDDSLWDISPYADVYAWHGIKEVKHGDEWLWKDGEGEFNIRRNKRRLERDLRIIQRANLITVSTPRLKEQLSAYNPNIKVVYNGLNFDNWKPHKIEKTEEFRFGWSGGISHYGDLVEIRDDIEYILKKYPQSKFVMGGVKFEGITRNMNPAQVEHQEWVDCEGHPFKTILYNLDLAIIPIAKNTFNTYKSCLKWYEFASIKVPTLATNYPPYNEEMPGSALTEDFRKDIEIFMADKEKRDNLAEYGYNWVRKHRDIKKIVPELYGFISESAQ